MPRKDKGVTPSVTQKIQELGYNVSDWDDSKTHHKLNEDIIGVLSKASKKRTGKDGYPDRIYFNKIEKLLILVEEKTNIRDHTKEDIEKGAVSGIKWFLSFFTTTIFKNYKILGIAVSGNLSNSHTYKFDCFMIKNAKIEPVPQITNFQTEDKFLSVFNNFDEEEAIKTVSSVSKDINKLLRNIDSQKRPILLSALMISLFKPKDYENTFANTYYEYKGEDILSNLYRVVKNILEKENIPTQKIEVLEAEINSISNEQTLKNSDILKTILKKLDENIIPLFNIKSLNNSNYDIMGKFYEEFLRYAGVTNVKKGIVLTPRHISTLFTKLVDIKANDVILDLCCGTGAFLIAGMNKLISIIENSEMNDKEDKIKNVKEKQLIGFEINTTMYICAISNMLFRGDGKSNIYNYDSINDEKVDKILEKTKPTIGFINPPYSGKENKDNPTPKEITFLEKMLDNCSRYGVIIAPFSTYFSDDERRKNILKKHTLKYVINMPSDLFQPNAGTYTAVAVFETNKPHNYNDNVAFYDLKEDGLVLTKNKGRTDLFNKWNNIENKLLESLKTEKYDDDITSMKCKITKGSEWNIYAYSKTDYTNLSEKDFSKTIEDYLIFSIKKNMNILFEEINDFEILKILIKYFDDEENSFNIDDIFVEKCNKPIDISKWKEFKITDVFEKIESTKGEKTYELEDGSDVLYIAAKKTNNGAKQYVSLNENYISKGNCIVFVNIGDGASGYSTYQIEDFIGMSGKTTCGYSSRLNKYNALFLITILDKHRYKFCYGRAWNSKRLKNTKLSLPAKLNNKNQYEPDWEYMENYIKNTIYGKYL